MDGAVDSRIGAEEAVVTHEEIVVFWNVKFGLLAIGNFGDGGFGEVVLRELEFFISTLDENGVLLEDHIFTRETNNTFHKKLAFFVAELHHVIAVGIIEKRGEFADENSVIVVQGRLHGLTVHNARLQNKGAQNREQQGNFDQQPDALIQVLLQTIP